MGFLTKILALLASLFVAGSVTTKETFTNTELPTDWEHVASDVETVALPEDLLKDLQKGDVLLEAKNAIMTYFYKEVEEDTLISGANAGVVSMTNDIANVYYMSDAAEQLRNWPEDTAFTGAWLGRSRDSNWCIVTRVEAGSSAEKAGIQVGDIIYSVDDQVVSASTLGLAQLFMNGKTGSTVKVTLYRDYEEMEAELTCDTTATVCSAAMLSEKIAYLEIISLDESEAIEKAVAFLAESNPEVMIVDLRGAIGNDMDVTAKVAGALLGNVEIAKCQGKQGEPEVVKSEGSGLDIGYVVLVDQYTSDGAEILAQALREAKKAPLVGETTFGNTPKLTWYDLNDDLMCLATARYLSAEGVEIHMNGLEVDTEVERSADDDAADEDSQLNAALELAEKMTGEEEDS